MHVHGMGVRVRVSASASVSVEEKRKQNKKRRWKVTVECYRKIQPKAFNANANRSGGRFLRLMERVCLILFVTGVRVCEWMDVGGSV